MFFPLTPARGAAEPLLRVGRPRVRAVERGALGLPADDLAALEEKGGRKREENKSGRCLKSSLSFCLSESRVLSPVLLLET